MNVFYGVRCELKYYMHFNIHVSIGFLSFCNGLLMAFDGNFYLTYFIVLFSQQLEYMLFVSYPITGQLTLTLVTSAVLGWWSVPYLCIIYG